MSLSDIYLSMACANYSARAKDISLKRIKQSKVGNFISRNITAVTLPAEMNNTLNPRLQDKFNFESRCRT